MLSAAALILAAHAAAADTAAPPRPAQDDAPAVIVHHQPALPFVALRLSVVAPDPPGHAGAGHLMQHLLLPALEEQAARVGARVQAVRGADAVVYSVVGPASELDYLAGILRGALRVPQPGQGELLSSLGRLAEERAAEREAAATYVRAALRSRLFPADLPPAGTAEAAARLETARLAELWGEMYAPERVSVVAVGDVELDDVRRAFRALPPPPSERLSAAPAADTVVSLAADTPQATRGWIAAAYPAPEADAAALTVTVRLLRNHLRRRMTRSAVEVEHWWTHHGQALALVVATPDSLVPAARRTVDGALGALGGTLNEGLVREAGEAVRREILFYSRTPERMAEVLGAFADRGGGPGGAQRFYARVGEVGEAEVRAVLELLAAQEAATILVPPQRIRRESRR
ncbi:MAG TPA: hypothetical protein VHG91_01400 [Longimicrobium sp.]|nr:hypothetical protein [Longimicrobium sp.]